MATLKTSDLRNVVTVPSVSGVGLKQSLLNGIDEAKLVELHEAEPGQVKIHLRIDEVASCLNVAPLVQKILDEQRPLAVVYECTIDNGHPLSQYTVCSPNNADDVHKERQRKKIEDRLDPIMTMDTVPDMSLEARVKRKLKDKYGEDSDEAMPRDLARGTIDGNVLSGEAVERFREDPKNQTLFVVRFTLNGLEYRVEAPATDQFIAAAGTKGAMANAIISEVAREIARQMFEKLGLG